MLYILVQVTFIFKEMVQKNLYGCYLSISFFSVITLYLVCFCFGDSDSLTKYLLCTNFYIWVNKTFKEFFIYHTYVNHFFSTACLFNLFYTDLINIFIFLFKIWPFSHKKFLLCIVYLSSTNYIFHIYFVLYKSCKRKQVLKPK